jgi:hypothetical protein
VEYSTPLAVPGADAQRSSHGKGRHLAAREVFLATDLNDESGELPILVRRAAVLFPLA